MQLYREQEEMMMMMMFPSTRQLSSITITVGVMFLVKNSGALCFLTHLPLYQRKL